MINKSVKVLSCGAGMQSTALALMSCENALAKKSVYPLVPVYDVIVFCDLKLEPPWVYAQVDFIRKACQDANIDFVVLESDLYSYYLQNFGIKKYIKPIPFWTLSDAGKKGRMPRHCTIDFKILKIIKYVKEKYLGCKKYERIKPEDIGKHEMHIGFSKEESNRSFASKNLYFTNKYPLIEMGLTRADNYAYIKERWKLETKASACCFCPFHTNYFFAHLKLHYPALYEQLIKFDGMLESRRKGSNFNDALFISKSRKRIEDLRPEDCKDKECFDYKDDLIWNGF